MAAEGDKSCDFYGVLGLTKESSSAELRHAYKKLALKWHPDRFSATENLKHVDEAKKKFQAIQQAYSVLSDTNKRFLYDLGVYDCNDDDDNNGMGDFLNEMVTMMSQTKPEERGSETLEELQELFDELFDDESATPSTCSCASSSSAEAYGISNKRNSTEMRSDNLRVEGFCLGTGGTSGKHSIEQSEKECKDRSKVASL